MTKPPDLALSFDVGHSSLGWAVLQTTPKVEIKGCGVVTFRADDCLASDRRKNRRQRRHIRATRQRIRRMKALLAHLDALTMSELDHPGNAWPWKLAARVLCGGKTLLWGELWNVLRWYAHNRGYDGNRRWSATEVEEKKEDAEKVQNAHSLMDKHGVTTMAETFCKELGVDPLGERSSSAVRFKGLNAAFPRSIVEAEVMQILRSHFDKLKGVDERFITALFSDWKAVPCPGIQLPQRYQGGLLFGQLVPRFDNRIISRCPITGEKVPSKNTTEFLNFRWAMTLANVRVARPVDRELKPLTTDERHKIDAAMRQEGRLTVNEFKNVVRKASGATRDNLDTMLMHPDAEDALSLNPVQKLVTSGHLKTLWPTLPLRVQKRAFGQLRRGKRLVLGNLANETEAPQFGTEVQRILDKAIVRGRKKDKPLTRESLLATQLEAPKLDGRAAYARSILRKAFEEVMSGKHPKEEGGCLFATEQMRQAQLNRSLAEQTNNHLVRHRLLILERLVADVIKEYAGGDKSRIGRLTIEVNRDLREMSGKTAKEKAQDMGQRIANHHHVVKKLEEAFKEQPFNGKPIRITAGLIRKARIAEDLGWTCPYTGQRYEPIDLVTRRVDKDHVVPRSERASDALEALVITFSQVNAMKGKRTAWQFVQDDQGKTVRDLPQLSIVDLKRYRNFVEGLESFKGHNDDKRRKKRRKELMLLPKYEEKEFTPRDLTQTSQLVRLGALTLRRAFGDVGKAPVVVSLPGAVTGEVRKAWKVLGCLSLACPQVLDEHGNTKTKTDVRELTHLHHALDACVLGLAAHFIPNNGSVWDLIVKRNLNDSERAALRALGVYNVDSEGRFGLRDLQPELKEQIRCRLAEKRVVQHVPKRMSGLRAEQNTWRVRKVENNEATIEQRIRQPDGKRPFKQAIEQTTKLMGLKPGKLNALKGALVVGDNYGIALDPTPTIIPHHKVWPHLMDLKTKNDGKMPRILRNGQLIRMAKGRYKGTWRVFSAKNNRSGMALDMGSPDVVRLKNGVEGHKINVLLSSLLRDDLKVLPAPLTGIPTLKAEM